MSMEDCPFCGADEDYLRIHDPYNDGSSFCVICDFCESCGPDALTEEDAIKKWNRRVI
jgi:Lar family restriction alleviation protein